jgi:hypothetical protein
VDSFAGFKLKTSLKFLRSDEESKNYLYEFPLTYDGDVDSETEQK